MAAGGRSTFLCTRMASYCIIELYPTLPPKAFIFDPRRKGRLLPSGVWGQPGQKPAQSGRWLTLVHRRVGGAVQMSDSHIVPSVGETARQTSQGTSKTDLGTPRRLPCLNSLPSRGLFAGRLMSFSHSWASGTPCSREAPGAIRGRNTSERRGAAACFTDFYSPTESQVSFPATY